MAGRCQLSRNAEDVLDPTKDSYSQAEQLAWRLEKALFDSELGEPGLGGELNLIERFGVSRATLRQALRILESHGAVRMKPGPSGGVVATRPDGEFTFQLIALQLRIKGASIEHGIEARGLLERACADRILRAPRMADNCRAMSDGGLWQLAAIDPLADFAAQVLDRIHSSDGHFPDGGGHSGWTLADEAGLARLSAALDDGLARMDEAAADLAERRGCLLQRRCAVGRPGGDGRPTQPRLRAVQIAQTILAAADPALCKAGTRIGTVLELAERFNTAPSIMSQAVRILQAYGIMECQRGRIGGLILRAPDNAAIFRAIQLYLAASDITADQCGLVWDLCRLQARIAARRRLWTAEMQHWHDRLGGGGSTFDSDVVWLGLQGALAGAVANPVLLVFLQCFSAYRNRKTQARPYRIPSAPQQARLAGHVIELLDAVRQGDEDAAADAQSRCQRVLDHHAPDHGAPDHAIAPAARLACIAPVAEAPVFCHT